jgi:hypothetical protein
MWKRYPSGRELRPAVEIGDFLCMAEHKYMGNFDNTMEIETV